MKIVFDANVIIDLLTNRDKFAEQARQVFTVCDANEYEGLVSAGEMTTLYYVLRKHAGKERALDYMRTLYKQWRVIDVSSADIEKALQGNMPDFEDAVLAYSAKRAKADYIITRNLKDFKESPVPAISPADFIKKMQTDE